MMHFLVLVSLAFTVIHLIVIALNFYSCAILLLKDDSPAIETVNEDIHYGGTAAHHAAAQGDVDELRQIGLENRDLLFTLDENGFQPLHEAAMRGHVDAVEMLLSYGADINYRTNFDIGGTPLYWAIEKLGSNHDVVAALQQRDAKLVEPYEELEQETEEDGDDMVSISLVSLALLEWELPC